MYPLVFGCMLVLQGVSGSYLFPAWRPSTLQGSLDETQAVLNETAPEPQKYFQTFNLRNLNPVYWFYDTSEVDKLDKLYELVECVIENEADGCRKKLQISRQFFQKKQVKVVRKEVEVKSTTVGSTSKIQNKNQDGVEARSEVHNSTLTETEHITTKVITVQEDNDHTVPSK